ncbi:MAG: hypothetical protein DWQ02_21255 [Bacteroidetes bacterium]|nr:MAG: hypothetical protein DWQ02_21255 [Bacteroidota bacterium]
MLPSVAVPGSQVRVSDGFTWFKLYEFVLGDLPTFGAGQALCLLSELCGKNNLHKENLIHYNFVLTLTTKKEQPGCKTIHGLLEKIQLHLAEQCSGIFKSLTEIHQLIYYSFR